MSWSQPMIDFLKVMWADGVPVVNITTAINREFKTAFTKNAIIGRARRSDLGQHPDAPELGKLRKSRGVGVRHHPRRKRGQMKPPPRGRGGNKVCLRPKLTPQQMADQDAKFKAQQDNDFGYAFRADGGEDSPTPKALWEIDDAVQCTWPLDTEEGLRYCGCAKGRGMRYCARHDHMAAGPPAKKIYA